MSQIESAHTSRALWKTLLLKSVARHLMNTLRQTDTAGWVTAEEVGEEKEKGNWQTSTGSANRWMTCHWKWQSRELILNAEIEINISGMGDQPFKEYNRMKAWCMRLIKHEVTMERLNSHSPIWAYFLHWDRGDDTAEPPLWRWLTSQRWSLYWQSTDLGAVEHEAVLFFIFKSFCTPKCLTTVSYKDIIKAHFYIVHQCPLTVEENIILTGYSGNMWTKNIRNTWILRGYFLLLFKMNKSFIKYCHARLVIFIKLYAEGNALLIITLLFFLVFLMTRICVFRQRCSCICLWLQSQL